MALHGTIAVNGVTIGGWTARRTHADVRHGDEQSQYACEAVRFSDGQTATFWLLHHYDEGAFVLASQVMATAAELLAEAGGA